MLFSLGCRSKKEYVYRDHIIDNSEFKHLVEVQKLGVNTTTIIPCKEIDQVVTLGETKVELTSVDSTDMIRVHISQPEESYVKKDSTYVENIEKITEEKKEIVYERYIPKFIWYILIASVVLNIWAYRKTILTLLRKLIIKI